MMKFITFIFSVWGFVSFAQDYHLTQMDKTMTIWNPSATSMHQGFEKISVQNRNQWLGAGTQFMTSYGMGEFSVGKTKKSDKAYSGIGVFFSNDVGGDSKMSQKSFGTSVSGHLPLAKGHWLSAGIQTAFCNRSADFSRLLYYSQWNGTSLDPNVYSGEVNDFTSFSYLDAGLGMNYRYIPGNKPNLGAGQLSFLGGFSIAHVNSPRLNYNSLTTDRLFRKFCFHTQFKYAFDDKSSMELSVMEYMQGPHKETIIGLFYRSKLRGNSEVTNMVNSQSILMGFYLRSMGTIAPYFSMTFGSVDIGMSYDLDLGTISSAYRHSIEVNFAYTFTKKSLFKGSRLH
ncbi:MAG: PorP/SprF family type IX secretion system membrane protein [Flavobacteriales bacterium]